MPARVTSQSARFHDDKIPVRIAFKDAETKAALLTALKIVAEKVGFEPSIPQLVSSLIKDYAKRYGNETRTEG